MHNGILKNRIEAGILLSERLKKYQHTDSIILAVPRGGVPVGYEIARRLHLPLDIVLSKKIGHPSNKEFAIGAVSLDTIILNKQTTVPKEYIEKEIEQVKKTLKEKDGFYRKNRSPLDIEEKNVIVVDDGIATGNTLLASIALLRKKHPAKIIVAVPVIPYENIPIFEESTDEFIYLMAPKYFRGVGGFYEDFPQVEDEEVIQMLNLTNPNK
jgi:putative phosphoribosyl transferase